MATELRLRRGTTAQHSTFVGAMAEVTVDTTTKSLVVHDGVTPGGTRQATPAEVAAAVAGKQDALGFTPEDSAKKGVANGYAGLDGTGKVPLTQLPTISAGEEVITPTNVAPANGATGQTETPTFQGSAFYSQYSQTHAATQLQVSLVADFSTTVYSSGDSTATTTPTIPAGVLAVSTTYYWRLRYKNSRGTYSNWSSGTSFVTAATFNSYIPTPAATPAIGASFEGGFYGGMIWNELVQSSTSTTIGTGSKAFTVPSMIATPIVYAGQQLEVRSRANPNNRMIGTVTGAAGTTLTINVTSVTGSGTFTDWSIMSRYRIVVAPKASGQATKAYSAADGLITGAATLSEGAKATAAIVAAGNATAFPAAHWCNDLVIGAYTDWYLPTRDECEVAYRNLKRDATANSTALRSTSALAYTNLGSLQDASTATGTNQHSSPIGAAYTSGSPGITSASNFISGASESFDANYYLTSTQFSATQVWLFAFDNGQEQESAMQPTARLLRAFRRSII